MCSLEQPDDRVVIPSETAAGSSTPGVVGAPGVAALAGMPAQCPWCGMWHGKLCPFVKAISWHPNGAIARVEFHDLKRDPATGVLKPAAQDNVALALPGGMRGPVKVNEAKHSLKDGAYLLVAGDRAFAEVYCGNSPELNWEVADHIATCMNHGG